MSNAVPSCPEHSTPSPQGAPFAGQTVLFDATHGQPNWGETGYSSREMHSNFAGLAQVLCRLGCTCVALNERPLTKLLGQAKLLVIPPPTGRYHARKQCWSPDVNGDANMIQSWRFGFDPVSQFGWLYADFRSWFP